MATFIALLRGINVGGHHPVNMAELRALCNSLGYGEVTTYIQSGNIVFRATTSPVDIENQLSEGILQQFGFEIPVMVLEAGEFRQIMAGNPFIADSLHDASFLHLTLLTRKPDQEALSERPFPTTEGEEMMISGHTIYLYLPNGYGRTRLNNNFFETRLKQQATTRNWKTMQELLKIAENIERKNK